MWKIYLCGHDEKRPKEANWREQLKQVFKNKYLILEPDKDDIDLQKKLENGMLKSVSLEKYMVSPHKAIVLSKFSKIKESDLVIANASMPSFEIILQLFYSHLLRKPIILFVDHEILEREVTYISLMADLFFQSYNELVKYLQEMKTLPFPKHSLLRDTLLRGLQEEVARIFSREDRKDALFRAAILTTQLGQLLHYLTHDRRINPAARSIGSRADEEAQLGDSLIQLLIYCISRGFNIDDVYSIGMKRMEEIVWRSRQPEIAPRELRPNEIGYGISASSGEVTGRVVVIKTMEDVSRISIRLRYYLMANAPSSHIVEVR